MHKEDIFGEYVSTMFPNMIKEMVIKTDLYDMLISMYVGRDIVVDCYS